MMAFMQAVMKARGVRPGQEGTEYPKAEEKTTDQNTVAEDTDCIAEAKTMAGFASSKPLAPVAPPPGLEQETSVAKQIRVLLGELGGRPVDKLLAEVADIASQIEKVDLVLAKAAKSAPPPGSEAEKWHKMAVNTASWSRQTLVERQGRCLEKIREVGPSSPAMKQVPTPPSGSPVQRVRVPMQPPTPPPRPSAPSSERAARRCFESDGDGSMKKGLESLRDYDADRVLIVRKIKKLGFESPELLSKHFKQFGGVSGVHVANSMMKPNSKRPTGRLRPAALGFVVMASAEATQAALAHGSTHKVGSADIEVKEFSPFEEEAEDDA